MANPLYLVDTHALFWHEFNDPRLPVAVRQVFAEADAGNVDLVLHPIVLAEYYFVLRKEGFEQDAPTYLQYLEAQSGYRLESIPWADVQQLPNFTEIPEMHDRLIAIAAKRLGATVLTKDRFIQASTKVKWLW